jgi:hypothetical protein
LRSKNRTAVSFSALWRFKTTALLNFWYFILVNAKIFGNEKGEIIILEFPYLQ